MFITMAINAKIQIRTNITMAKVDLEPIKIMGVYEPAIVRFITL